MLSRHLKHPDQHCKGCSNIPVFCSGEPIPTRVAIRIICFYSYQPPFCCHAVSFYHFQTFVSPLSDIFSQCRWRCGFIVFLSKDTFIGGHRKENVILLTALTRICFAISAGLLKDSEKESTCCLRRPALHLYDWRSYKPVSWERQCIQAHREFVSHYCIRLSNLGCST